MFLTNIHRKGTLLYPIIIVLFLLNSCTKFVDIGAPVTQIGVTETYQSSGSATSAIIGLYNNYAFTSLVLNYTVIPGSSADDIRLSTSSPANDEFANNAIQANNSTNSNILWSYSYTEIYQINLAIQGLNATTSLAPLLKNQLLGEAKTLRAFVYFYLVNFYGDVPLELSTSITENAKMPRTEATKVWAQIIADLKDATGLLSVDYQMAPKARINKYTAMALLAKAYLYTGDWVNAEDISNQIITSGAYSLNTDLNAVFINTSSETIFQIATSTGISVFGSNFLAPKGVLANYVLYDTLFHSFEQNDLRRQDWVTSDTIGNTPYYYDYKYKQRAGNGNEYNVVFRLAEQYLISAEAKAQQNKIEESVAQVNVIRNRAGLPSIGNNISKSALLLAIEQERKVELFGEWGNRWFDLRRTPSLTGTAGLTRADDILKGMKAAWKSTAVLYPIPEDQRLANDQLSQNNGY